MKFKIFSVRFGAAILMLLAASAPAQLNVNTIPTSGLNEPSGFAEDAAGNYYLADSSNHRIVRLDGTYLTLSVLAGTGTAGTNDGPGFLAMFNNPQGILMAGTNELVVADYGNNLIRIVRLSDGYVSTLAGQNLVYNGTTNELGVNASFRYPSGLTADLNGNIYIADWGNSAIRVMNLNDPAHGVTNLTLSGATLFRPWAVAFAGANQLWVADSGYKSQSDNTIRLFTLSTPTTATLTTSIGGNSIQVAGGFRDSPVGANALFNQPHGLLWVPGAGLFVCDTGNHCIRLATNNPAYGATNYAVTTFAGFPQSAGTADGPVAIATFTAPNSLLLNGPQSFYLTDSGSGIGNPLRSLQNGIQDFSPEPPPIVGWVTTGTDPTTGQAEATLHNAADNPTPKTFYNDNPVPPEPIALGDTAGLTIRFAYGPATNVITDPTQFTNSALAYDYTDSSPANVPTASIMTGKQPCPKMYIAAYAVAPIGSPRPPSAVAYGYFNFQVYPPQNIAPDQLDAFHIQPSCGTSNAIIYYTLDGSDPATSSNPLVYNQNDPYLSIDPAYFTNGAVTLNMVARKAGYADGVFTPKNQTFYLSNAVYRGCSESFCNRLVQCDFRQFRWGCLNDLDQLGFRHG